MVKIQIHQRLFPFFAFFVHQSISSVLLMAASTGRYPLPDIRHTIWPLAQFSSSQLECFTELDQRFIFSGRTYRLVASGRMPNGACLVRIPTSSRLKVSQLATTTSESYVLVIAGSSDLHMPLRTKHIRKEYPDRYRPWHVPCNRAYLVFHSKGDNSLSEEWIEFNLAPETEEDRRDGDREDCAADGRNFASVELLHR